MSTLNFQLLLCLDGVALPVVKESLPIIDTYALGGNLEHLSLDEDLPVDLLSFKASADVHWLMPALGMPLLPLRWWVSNSTQLALLQDISVLIKDKKPTHEGQYEHPRAMRVLVQALQSAAQ